MNDKNTMRFLVSTHVQLKDKDHIKGIIFKHIVSEGFEEAETGLEGST